jgi:hypothetical protein
MSAPRATARGSDPEGEVTNAGVVGALMLALTLTARPGFAQVSLSGDWGPRMHEDQPDRGPGPDLGDYTGLPLTDGARLAADSWDASRLTLREHQCKVHRALHHARAAAGHIQRERQQTQQLTAIRIYISIRAEPDDLDGRPAASARYAAHVAGLTGKGRRHPHVYTTH